MVTCWPELPSHCRVPRLARSDPTLLISTTSTCNAHDHLGSYRVCVCCLSRKQEFEACNVISIVLANQSPLFRPPPWRFLRLGRTTAAARLARLSLSCARFRRLSFAASHTNLLSPATPRDCWSHVLWYASHYQWHMVHDSRLSAAHCEIMHTHFRWAWSFTTSHQGHT